MASHASLSINRMPNQAENEFGNIILNNECQACQGDNGPGGITDKRTKLDEQRRDKSTRGAAPDRLCCDNPGRRTESDCQNE